MKYQPKEDQKPSQLKCSFDNNKDKHSDIPIIVKIHIYIYIYIWMYLHNFSAMSRMWHKVNFEWSLTDLNSEYSFS